MGKEIMVFNFHVLLFIFLRVTWNYSSLNIIFKGIRELKLRQIEVNIIFGWSRQNSDEMAISNVLYAYSFIMAATYIASA